MTASEAYELRVQMWKIDGSYAEVAYDAFAVGDEASKYALDLGNVVEPNPYGVDDDLVSSDGAPFSTADQDNSAGGCPIKSTANWQDSPWWYALPSTGIGCPRAGLFGRNENTDFMTGGTYFGIHWRSFTEARHSLARVRMSIRPADFESVSE